MVRGGPGSQPSAAKKVPGESGPRFLERSLDLNRKQARETDFSSAGRKFPNDGQDFLHFRPRYVRTGDAFV